MSLTNTKTLILTGLALASLSLFSATMANADPLDNWAVQQLNTDILTGVTYGNGLYVIVGQTNGKIWTSPDASTWTNRTYDTSSHSYCVTFANGVFVAGGDYQFPNSGSTAYQSGVQSSTDGINWTSTGLDYYGTPASVSFTNNVFYAMSSGLEILTSADGFIWGGGNNRYSIPDLYGVAYGNGMYVVIAKPSLDNTNVWANSSPPSSGLPEPINSPGYFRTSGTSNDLFGVAFGNSTFVAVGAAGTIITSPNGITWTIRTSGTTNTLNAIAFGGGVFATAGAGGTILTSPDGITWTARASSTTNLLRGIAYTNNRFIAVGVGGTVTISGIAAPNSGAVANISTRGLVGTGNDVMIGGIIIQDGNKNVIVRAVGPSLAAFGITDALADPTLELHDHTGALIATNDDWQTTQIVGIITNSQVAAIQNSGHAPSSPKESAIIATLSPGSYTAIVRGANGTTGTGLVEVFALP